MNLYAFELGRKKDLCFAELIAVLGKDKLVERNLDTAIFKLELPDAQKLQDQLGGTVKIIQLWEDFKSSNTKPDHSQIEKNLEKHLMEIFQNVSGKINFSVSTLSFKDHREINIKQTLNFSKKILKSIGLNSRFVNKNFQNTRPSTIFKARVLEKGIDINILKGNNQIFLGETVSIQNINDYSKRDYSKPKRDAKVGMMPPKLCQIMINLAGTQTKTIYDPFCGCGGILIEGLLTGKAVVGSDIDSRMADYTKENLEWTIREFSKKFQNTPNFRLFTKDARFLTKADLPEKINAVITEGYLGEPLTRLPSPEERQKIFRELANLHLNWLRAVNPLTTKNCKIVMCVTAFKLDSQKHHFKNHNQITAQHESLPRFNELAREAGYQVVASYIYDRPDQIIARKIEILEKLN